MNTNGNGNEPIYSLHELLSHKTLAVLKDIAHKLGLKGYSGLRKDLLIDRIRATLLSVERLENLLYIIDSSSWKRILIAFSSSTPVLIGSAEEGPCKVLADIGYFQWIESDDGNAIFMPDEVRDVFRQMVEGGFVEAKERSDLLDNYAMAATNLYGVISQDDFVALFNQQNKQKTDVDEVFQVLIQHISANAPYCFWDEYLTHYLFENNDFKDVESLIRVTQNKPKFFPEKELFLKYAEPDYYEETEVTVRLEQFLTPHLKNLPLKFSMAPVKEVISEIVFACTVDASMRHIFSIFEQYCIQFTKAQAMEAAKIVVDLINNTRKWSNNGYTPNELRQISRNPPSIEKRKKVGRNDLCPCGSGKKFKKCCGR